MHMDSWVQCVKLSVRLLHHHMRCILLQIEFIKRNKIKTMEITFGAWALVWKFAYICMCNKSDDLESTHSSRRSGCINACDLFTGTALAGCIVVVRRFTSLCHDHMQYLLSFSRVLFWWEIGLYFIIFKHTTKLLPSDAYDMSGCFYFCLICSFLLKSFSSGHVRVVVVLFYIVYGASDALDGIQFSSRLYFNLKES